MHSARPTRTVWNQHVCHHRGSVWQERGLTPTIQEQTVFDDASEGRPVQGGSLRPSISVARRCDKYVDKTNYLKTQPKDQRKRGFMSSDAMRRDEFMNHIRTEQWRWALGREQDFRKHHEAQNDEKNLTKTHPRPPPLPALGERAVAYHTPHHLYDIGKGNCVTSFSQKLPRENWFLSNRDLSKPRNCGDWVPSSYEIGNEMVQQTELHKPSYASTPIVQSTFYRVGSVKANAGWSPIR